MKVYLAKIDQLNAPKNKLELSVQTLLRQYDRLIIKEEMIEDVKNGILDLIEKENKEHIRCKPINAKWWSPPIPPVRGIQDWSLDVGGFVYFKLYSSKAY